MFWTLSQSSSPKMNVLNDRRVLGQWLLGLFQYDANQHMYKNVKPGSIRFGLGFFCGSCSYCSIQTCRFLMRDTRSFKVTLEFGIFVLSTLYASYILFEKHHLSKMLNSLDHLFFGHVLHFTPHFLRWMMSFLFIFSTHAHRHVLYSFLLQTLGIFQKIHKRK